MSPKAKPGLNQTLRITISKTADGRSEYLQIMSADVVSVNIVLVASNFIVEDKR